jgi:hypothetical protein
MLVGKSKDQLQIDEMEETFHERAGQNFHLHFQKTPITLLLVSPHWFDELVLHEHRDDTIKYLHMRI